MDRFLTTTLLTFAMSLAAASTGNAQGDWSFDGDWLPNDAIHANIGLQVGWDLASGEAPYYQVTLLPGPDAEEAGAYLFKLPIILGYRDRDEWWE